MPLGRASNRHMPLFLILFEDNELIVLMTEPALPLTAIADAGIDPFDGPVVGDSAFLGFQGDPIAHSAVLSTQRARIISSSKASKPVTIISWFMHLNRFKPNR